MVIFKKVFLSHYAILVLLLSLVIVTFTFGFSDALEQDPDLDAINARIQVLQSEAFNKTVSLENSVLSLPADVITEWWSYDELIRLGACVFWESWGCPDEQQQYVAAVVINRARDESRDGMSFGGNTILSVLGNTLGYASSERIMVDDPVTKIISYQIKCNASEENAWVEWYRCMENARKALKGEVDIPSNVVYQANFHQGSGVWKTCEHGNTVTYFCYK